MNEAESKLRVGLLLCDDVDTDAQRHYGTYAEMFAGGLQTADSNLTLTTVRCHLDELPDSPHDFDAFLISGSRRSVYEPEPWIMRLKMFVQACRAANKKTVGICFGHQLIAHALGGTTQKAEAGWGAGIHNTRITKPQLWMESPNPMDEPTYNLVVLHQDQVAALPLGGEVIAENDFCPISMFAIDNVMLGIQGHPEFDKLFCKYRIDCNKHTFGHKLHHQSLTSLEQMTLNSDRIFNWIARFIRH